MIKVAANDIAVYKEGTLFVQLDKHGYSWQVASTPTKKGYYVGGFRRLLTETPDNFREPTLLELTKAYHHLTVDRQGFVGGKTRAKEIMRSLSQELTAS